MMPTGLNASAIDIIVDKLYFYAIFPKNLLHIHKYTSYFFFIILSKVNC